MMDNGLENNAKNCFGQQYWKTLCDLLLRPLFPTQDKSVYKEVYI